MGTASAWSSAARVSSAGTAGCTIWGSLCDAPNALRPNLRDGLDDPTGEEEAPHREGEAAEPGHGEQWVPPTRRHQRPRDHDGRSQRGQRGGPKHRAARRLRGEREQEHAQGEDVQDTVENQTWSENAVPAATPSEVWKRSIIRT